METYHEPVLCEEVLGFLLTDPGGVYIDGTIGGGGHAEKICEKLSGSGRLIGFDADGDALLAAETRLVAYRGRIDLVRMNFRHLHEELERRQIIPATGILLDLGVSSHQLDAEEKGFSFRRDERLDMRLDQRQGVSAWQVVNEYAEARLSEIFSEYGEEHHARRIARMVVRARPVETTGALASIVRRCVGERFLNKSLARIFQALRIEVNDELGSLREVLKAVPEVLAPGGRCVVISYHSLEDRIVKQFFRAEGSVAGPSRYDIRPAEVRIPRFVVLTKRPVLAGEDERARNPRARSAKLRAAERRAA